MQIAAIAFCFFLVSASIYGQTQIPNKPPIFDKKFWTVASVLVGSTITQGEATVFRHSRDLSETRLKIYTAYGIYDFFIIAMSANLKSDGKKWWWIPSVAISALNGGVAIKYFKNF